VEKLIELGLSISVSYTSTSTNEKIYFGIQEKDTEFELNEWLDEVEEFIDKL